MSPDRFTVEALMAHEGLVRGLARSVLRGDDRVDDVVQETFATSLTASPKDRGALGRWLGTISRRLALRVKRRDEARRRRESAPRGRSAVPTPAEITEREETRRAVLAALLDLDPLYRDALLLRFYEDLPPREVAAALEVPVETARTRIKRGIASLRRTLRNRYGDRKRALPLALVFLAESPKPATALPAFFGLKFALTAITLVGAGFGVVALVRSSDVPTPPPAHRPADPPTHVAAPEPGPEAAPASGPAAQEPRPAPAGTQSEFAGMVSIPAGSFRMGLDEKTLVRLYGDPNRNPTRKHHKVLTEKDKLEWWNMLLLETPGHDVSTEAYSIDVHPVTNAQYLQFLESSARTRVRTGYPGNTLKAITKNLHGELIDDDWLVESLFWINEEELLSRWHVIRNTNAQVIETILEEFNALRPKQAWITDFRKLPDKQRAEGWVQFLLPRRITLTAYTRPIPDHWLRPVPANLRWKSEKHIPRTMLTKEMERWPVAWVTAEDADAFAEWAGRHLPTEAEWEKAGRGPKGWLYPWGPTWNWKAQRNLLVWRDATPRPAGPAALYKDHPVDVSRCRNGASPYGLMHMLGNVREWTSSVPTLYPDSKGAAGPWLNHDDFRVIRSTSYGDGLTSDGTRKPNLELMHRLTARVLEYGVTQRFQAVGFRCARYPQPARDVLAGRLERLTGEGALPANLGLDLPRTLGMEKLDEDPRATDTVYVRRRARAIGFVPVSRIIERNGVEILGWLWWNADVKLRIRGGRRLEAGETGLLVASREGVPGLFRHAARGPKLVAHTEEPATLRRADPSDPAAGLTYADGTILIRVDLTVRNVARHATLRLALPLTFEGRELPDDSWRR